MLKINKISFLCNKNKGLTLIELLVTIAVLVIVSSFAFASYSNVLEKQRMQSDMSALNNIDNSLKQIFIYDDAFDEIKDCIYDDNKLELTFHVVKPNDKSKSYVDVEKTTIRKNNESLLLNNECEILYGYLTEYVGTTISFSSLSYKEGNYCVYIEFNGSKISDVRDYVISNDVIKITNSGDTKLK